jgi:CubicO group peptidase (beta-lactamase class C family)
MPTSISNVQQHVQPVLDDLVSSGVELGLQVAAYLDGELVLDAWSGVADATTARPVDGDTLFVAFSCGKGVVATAIHLLAERGRIDYDAPVASYWPEFAANGKAGITVRQVLSHSAGIPQLPPGTSAEDLCDWNRICAGIAQLAPLWEPGTRSGYHARTMGFILGELIRRIDGRPINQFVRDELLQPLGITDLYFGVPPEVEPRIAHLEDGPALELPPPPPDSLLPVVFPPKLPPSAALFDRPDVRQACIPSSGGVMSARALARLYAMLACGGDLDDVRLLSPERLAQATELQSDAVDAVLGWPINRALGYMLGGVGSAMGPSLKVFGHPGSGGSIGFADPTQRFAFALLKTRLVAATPEEYAASRVAIATRSALGLG